MTNGVDHMARDRRLQKCGAVIGNIVDWKPKERHALLSMNEDKFGSHFHRGTDFVPN